MVPLLPDTTVSTFSSAMAAMIRRRDAGVKPGVECAFKGDRR
jgi:hypothetical protein